jgi:phenylalanyl-tRNA synthetase beta chain
MPTVTVSRSHLFHSLGVSYSDEQFEDLCFEFGIELDQITTEKEINSKQGQNIDKNNSEIEEVVYKIEVPANRYDLLCLEGLVNALKIFLSLSKPITYKVYHQEKPEYKLIQRKETIGIRNFVVAAVLRNVKFDNRNLKSFMDLQDKLHQNIGRKRTLASIGTHDLDTIKQPFYYEAKAQKDINFIALRETESRNVTQLFHHYKTVGNSPLAPYLHITEHFPLHPVIYDSNGVVCSLPPIINGEHSKITLNTKNVLIECTGTDYTKLNIVLNTVIAMFSVYCEEAYTVHAVEVLNESTGVTKVYPKLQNEVFNNISVDYINKGIGINLKPQEMVNLLNRMQLQSTLQDNNTLTVIAPITRTDILHGCDIMEDVAIAYGYNKIIKTLPQTSTIGKQQTINKLTDLNRAEIAQCGFNEVLTWALLSHSDNYSKLNQSEPSNEAVKVSNPKTAEFEIVRSSMLPGLLKALASNKGLVNLPIKLFEISDVCVQSKEKDVGAKNIRMAAALYCGLTSGLEIIHSLLDRIMLMNNYLSQPFINQQLAEQEKSQKADKTKTKAKKDKGNKAAEENKETAEEEEKKFEYDANRVYTVRTANNSTFLPGRSADIYIAKNKIGSFGILHPKVLQAYEINYPCSAVEINIEVFLESAIASKDAAGGPEHHEQPSSDHEKKFIH